MGKKLLSEPESTHFYNTEEFLKELKILPEFTIKKAGDIAREKIQFILNPEKKRGIIRYIPLIKNYIKKIEFLTELMNLYYGEIRTRGNQGLIKKLAKEFYRENKGEILDLYIRINYRKKRQNRDISNNFI